MTNEIQKSSGGGGAMVPIKSVDEMVKMGRLFETSGMFGCKAEGQGLVLVMSCLMSGMNPLEFQSKYHLIDGRPSMRAETMLAIFNERGGKHKILTRTAEKAEVELNKDGSKYVFSFTWEEAKKEDFVYQKDGKTFKHNWNTPRKRMQLLWARVVSDGIRAVDPGVTQGVYTPEETMDFQSEPTADYTPPKPFKQEPPKNQPAAKANPKEQPATADDSENKVLQAEVVEDEVDYSIVPVGGYKGKKWSELGDDVLDAAFKSKHSSITDKHKEEIKEEINNRKKAKK